MPEQAVHLAVAGWTDCGPVPLHRERVQYTMLDAGNETEALFGMVCHGHGKEDVGIVEEVTASFMKNLPRYVRRRHGFADALKLAFAEAAAEAALFRGSCSMIAVLADPYRQRWTIIHIGNTTALLFDGTPLLSRREPTTCVAPHTLKNPEEWDRIIQSGYGVVAGDYVTMLHEGRTYATRVTRALGAALFKDAGIINEPQYLEGVLSKEQALVLASEGFSARLGTVKLGELYSSQDSAEANAERFHAAWKRSFDGGPFHEDVHDNGSCVVITCR